MRYLSLGEIVALHQALLEQTGGATAQIGCQVAGELPNAWIDHLHLRVPF